MNNQAQYNYDFDYDGSVAPFNLCPSVPTLQMMKQLIASPHTNSVGILTGKPLDYIVGVFRGYLEACEYEHKIILSGNNGFKTQTGIAWPPAHEHFLCGAKDELDVERLQAPFLALKRKLLVWAKENGHHIWFQSNNIGITPFSEDETIRLKIKEIAEKELSDADIFLHPDAVDILPKDINKGALLDDLFSGKWGLEKLAPENTLVIGDGSNDIPMMKKAQEWGGYAVAIGRNEQVIEVADVHFLTIESALATFLAFTDVGLHPLHGQIQN